MSQHTDPRKLIFASTKIRCVLAHDHVLVRQGLRRLLEDEPDIEVISEASAAAECLRQVYAFRPDVVVADSRTFTAYDAELCVSRKSCHTKFVFLSTEKELGFANYLAKAKAEGCDVRQTSAEELVRMVRHVCCGDRIELQQSCSGSNPQDCDETLATAQRALTAREEEVLKLLAEGKTVRKAATVLGVSSKTVDSHKFNLMRKLGIHNKAELVMCAVQRKLVKIPAHS